MINTLPLSSQCFRPFLNNLSPPNAVPIRLKPQGLPNETPSLEAMLKNFHITQVKLKDPSLFLKSWQLACLAVRITVWLALSATIVPLGFSYHGIRSLYCSLRAKYAKDPEKTSYTQNASKHSQLAYPEFLQTMFFAMSAWSLWLIKEAISNFPKFIKEQDSRVWMVMLMAPVFFAICLAPAIDAKWHAFRTRSDEEPAYLVGLAQSLRDELGLMQENGDILPVNAEVDKNEGFAKAWDENAPLRTDFYTKIPSLLARLKFDCAEEFFRLYSKAVASDDKNTESPSWNNFSEIPSIIQKLEAGPQDNDRRTLIRDLKKLHRLISKVDEIFESVAKNRYVDNYWGVNQRNVQPDQMAGAKLDMDESLRAFKNDPYFFLALYASKKSGQASELQSALKVFELTKNKQDWSKDEDLLKTFCLGIWNDANFQEKQERLTKEHFSDLFQNPQNTNEIEKTFRKLTRYFHPDKQQDPAKKQAGETITKYISEGYALLKKA